MSIMEFIDYHSAGVLVTVGMAVVLAWVFAES